MFRSARIRSEHVWLPRPELTRDLPIVVATSTAKRALMFVTFHRAILAIGIFPGHAKMNKPAVFTSSWDDGHPLDMRLGDLLAKHEFPATFYVPLSNCEGLPVLSAEQVRGLGAAFEIGSHTLDHRYLNTVDEGEARRQIMDGKNKLEDILGYGVRGFCYPGGRFSAEHRRFTVETGFAYARTTVNFFRTVPDDRYRMPTTIQFYPHPRMAYVRNYLSKGNWPIRSGLFSVAVRPTGMIDRMRAMVDYVCRNGGVFHLWGHSWELDTFDGWQQLDRFLGYVGERIPRQCRLTNDEVAFPVVPSS
ncbi:MAG: polysaccharide deacetylase family protein [Sterolibacteriaceae bacterium]|nr:polysaccharide deacetylase family protein [Candidatus Methylophosphatis haderslevensis]